jgi:hypothetical protein
MKIAVKYLPTTYKGIGNPVDFKCQHPIIEFKEGDTGRYVWCLDCQNKDLDTTGLDEFIETMEMVKVMMGEPR